MSMVTLHSGAGDIAIELYPESAPLTVANFLRYVDTGGYEDAQFYRVVRDDNQSQNTVLIDVIQGGLGPANASRALKPIEHESTASTGLKHLDGTVSLARDKPGSGSSEFFICIGAQPSLDFGGLRNPDGQGFAAFGRVVGGMDVVRAIHRAPTVPADASQLEYTSGQMLVSPVPVRVSRRGPANQ